MKAKITISQVKQLAPAAQPYEVNDTDLTGFIARVQPSGVIGFYYSYRNKAGVRQRISLGKLGAVSVAQARAAADKAAGQVALDQDPMEERREAKRLHAEAEAAAANARTLREFLTGEFRDWCLTNRKRGKEDVGRLLASFQDLLDKKLDEIGAFDIQRWRTAKKKAGAAPGTINRLLAELKTALNRAKEWGFASVNNVAAVKPERVDNAVVRYLSPSEEGRLRDALMKREHAIRERRASFNVWRKERGLEALPMVAENEFADYLQPMVLLSLNTGMRQGEVFHLDWRQVSFARYDVEVTGEKSKSKKGRHIQLNSEALAVLKKWYRQRGEPDKGLVFPSRTGGPRDHVKNSWGALLRSAKVTEFRWHDLRHTFASKLVMRGVDLNTVRELLGHADIKMTLRYSHLAPEHKAAAVAKLVAA